MLVEAGHTFTFKEETDWEMAKGKDRKANEERHFHGGANMTEKNRNTQGFAGENPLYTPVRYPKKKQ